MNTTNKLIDFLYRFRISKNLIYRLLKSRAKHIGKRISPYLEKDDLILDIGPASCTVPELLMKQNLKVVPIDIENYSIIDTISPVIYDGQKMPFREDQFDTSLIFFVLHHTEEPADLLIEAKRVSRKIIIYEDIVNSSLHKYLTSALDNLINLEFYNQPHSNKSDEEWQIIFDRLGLKLLNREFNSYLFVIKQALYFLEK